MNESLDKDLDYIFDRTKLFIQKFEGKTIFVTGGTGFIGKWILEYFYWLNQKQSVNFKTLVLSRSPELFLKKFPKFRTPFIQFVKGDVILFDYNTLPNSDFIIHAATDADAKLNYEQPLKMIDTIVEGTRKVLDYAVKCKTQKVLYLSSGAIYGVQPNDIKGFSENYYGGPDVLSVSSAYSEAKRIAELYCACYKKQNQLNISIARCFAFIGPYLPLDKHFAIGNFIGNGLKGEDIVIKGNGLPLRSYMYVADLLVWLFYIFFKGENGQAYNIGSDHAISIKELALEVANFFPNVAVQVLGQVNPTDRNQNYIPNVNKIKTDLHVPEILSLSESIKRTIMFHSGDE